VKELRLKNIDSLDNANRYLEGKRCEERNVRFAAAAGTPQDFHLSSPGAWQLERIIIMRSHGEWGRCSPSR